MNLMKPWLLIGLLSQSTNCQAKDNHAITNHTEEEMNFIHDQSFTLICIQSIIYIYINIVSVLYGNLSDKRENQSLHDSHYVIVSVHEMRELRLWYSPSNKSSVDLSRESSLPSNTNNENFISHILLGLSSHYESCVWILCIMMIYAMYHIKVYKKLVLFMLLSSINLGGACIVAPNSSTDNPTVGCGANALLTNDSRNINVINSQNEWSLTQDTTNPLYAWGLKITLDAEKYGFKSGVSTISIELDCYSGSVQSDAFFGFSIGDNQYVTFGTDLDGKLQSNGKRGILIYPACGSHNVAIGDASTLIPTNSSNLYEDLRSKLAGSNNNNWGLLASTYNGANHPLRFKFLNNKINNTFTVQFETPKFPNGLQCVYDSAVLTQKDFKVFITPDADAGGETIIIRSLNITGINTGYTFSPTLSPTSTPTSMPTPSPSAYLLAPLAVLAASDVECAQQAKYLGKSFSYVDECAVAALAEPLCTGDEIKIMWSPGYYASWGCRCCRPNTGYSDYHQYWDVYRLVFPTPSPTVEPTSEPTIQPTMILTIEPTMVPTTDPTFYPLIKTDLDASLSPIASPTSDTHEAPIDVTESTAEISVVEHIDNSTDKNSEYITIYLLLLFIIAAIFILVAIIGYMNSIFLCKNDFFSVSAVISCMFPIFDFLSDIFLAINIWNRINEKLFLILFILSLIFIVLPIIISMSQLLHQIRKHWIRNDNIKNWLVTNAVLLFFLSVFTGSSFTAIRLMNSNLFNLNAFSMDLNKNELIRYQTKRVYSIVLVKNLPHVILQCVYLWRVSAFDGIGVSSMIFSIISIIVIIISMMTRKQILNNSGYAIVEFNVTGSAIIAKSDQYRNRTKGIRNQLASTLGLNNGLIEVTKPNKIPKGIKITINIHLNHILSRNIDYKEILNDCQQNGELAMMVKDSWNLDHVPIVSSIHFEVKESKDRIKNTVPIKIQSENISLKPNDIKWKEGMNNIHAVNIELEPIPQIKNTPGMNSYTDGEESDSSTNNGQHTTTMGDEKANTFGDDNTII